VGESKKKAENKRKTERKKEDKNTAVLKENAREAGDGETSYLPAYS
jgi:hypothetical protein